MLRGKVALVTGASRGIGAAIALEFAARGADVAAICRSGLEDAEAVCARCRDRFGVRAEAILCDVADADAVRETVAQVRAAFGTVHILVNNAGITRDGLIARMREEDFTAVLDTNLLGAFHMIRHCSGMFLRNREGCIINISSAAGLTGNAGQSNYAASKAGLIGLTKSVARELAPRGIRCNVIAPGFIRTDMTRDQENAPMLAGIPLGTMGDPEDVARAAAYLAEAGYVTGAVLRVDGGLAM